MSNFETIGDLVRAKRPQEWTEEDIQQVVDASWGRVGIDKENDMQSRAMWSGYIAGMKSALELVSIASSSPNAAK